MGSPNPENTSRQDLDDSGCVQDGSVIENGYKGQAQLLDLSDDVLLYILKNCSPRDLKALGHTCPRLGALVCDRTLWTRVDARSSPIGQTRLRWLLTHCLSPATLELKLTGYANKQSKCLGVQDLHWPVDHERGSSRIRPDPRLDVEHILLRMWYPHLPRFSVIPRWPDKKESETDQSAFPKPPPEFNGTGPSTSKKVPTTTNGEPTKKRTKKGSSSFDKEFSSLTTDCKGPQFTLSAHLLRDLRNTCSKLTSLTLEYCNIDYKSNNICQFPPTLKKLSLRGTLCYNIPMSTSYLGKIQDRMPGLEYLDVSECDWFEPASLMPISKLACLKELYMRDCRRLAECVAYASLATRYGFRQLKIIDVRGSPLADSEISALGWLPLLEELYCSPPLEFISSSEHTHSWKDIKLTINEMLDHWEEEEPEYYKTKTPEPTEDIEEDEVAKVEPDPNTSGPRDRIDDVLLGHPWMLQERRIIVIQPNAGRQVRPQPANVIHPEAAVLGPAEPGPAPAPQEPAPAPQDPVPMAQEPAPKEPVLAPKEPVPVPQEMLQIPQVPAPAPQEPAPMPQVPEPMSQEPEKIYQETEPMSQPKSQVSEPVQEEPAPMSHGSDLEARGSKQMPQEPEPMVQGSQRKPQRPDPIPQGSDPIAQGPDPKTQGVDPKPAGSDTKPQGSDPMPQRPDPIPQGPDPMPQRPDPMPQRPHPMAQGPDPMPQGPERAPRPLPRAVHRALMYRGLVALPHIAASIRQGAVRLHNRATALRQRPAPQQRPPPDQEAAPPPEDQRPGPSNQEPMPNEGPSGLQPLTSPPTAEESALLDETLELIHRALTPLHRAFGPVYQGLNQEDQELEEEVAVEDLVDQILANQAPALGNERLNWNELNQAPLPDQEPEVMDQEPDPVPEDNGPVPDQESDAAPEDNCPVPMDQESEPAASTDQVSPEPGPSKRPNSDSDVPKPVKRPRLDSDDQGNDNNDDDKASPVPDNIPEAQDLELRNQARLVPLSGAIVSQLWNEPKAAEAYPDFFDVPTAQGSQMRKSGGVQENPGPNTSTAQDTQMTDQGDQGISGHNIPSAEVQGGVQGNPRPSVQVAKMRNQPRGQGILDSSRNQPQEDLKNPGSKNIPRAQDPQASNSGGVQKNPDPNNIPKAQARNQSQEGEGNAGPSRPAAPDAPGVQVFAGPYHIPVQDPQMRNQGRRIQVVLNQDGDLLEMGNDLGIPVEIHRDFVNVNRDRFFRDLIQERPGNQPNVGAEECPRLRNQGQGGENRPRNADRHLDFHRQSTIHIGHTGYHLVSDSAILRFGRADNDNVNYVNIGPNGIRAGEPGTRPERSNLRVLSVTGYRNITDRSLVHLATAAPYIVSIDFSETNVTARGVEIFKAIRPNCEVIFSEYGKKSK